MQSIEAQLELEQGMVQAGAKRYLTAQRKAEEKGHGSDLDYSQRLIQDFIMPLAEVLESWKNYGAGYAVRYGRIRTALRQVESEAAMFLTLRALFNSFTHERSVVSLASQVGKAIEGEIRFTKFRELHQKYYDEIIADFKRKGTKDHRHMHRVLTHKANEKEDGWVEWTSQERVEVGSKLLDIILTNTDLITKVERYAKGKQVTEIVPTDEAMVWIKKHEDARQFMYPDKSPCIVPPDPWIAVDQGGYYTPMMRQTTPMIKTQISRKKLKALDLTQVMDAINLSQAVPWKVNKDVLAVMHTVWEQNLQIGMPSSDKLVPAPSPVVDIAKEAMTDEQLEQLKAWKHEASAVYTAEKERVSRSFQVARVMRMAQDYSQYDKFWYVWYADFRGRLYTATAVFSPQGPDMAKGLLLFGNGMKLGKEGLAWLKIHGANRYGYDKVGFAERIAWADERHELFIRTAADPLSNREVWANADKPWQFLAFIFEYAEAHSLANAGISPEEYISYLPVGLDGSCNGLQNFSAMLRDPIGGKATNLVPGTKPNDIYKQVADVCAGKLQAVLREPAFLVTETMTSHQMAQLWLDFGMDRKIAKRPVMTLPYGSTRQSCQQYIFQEILARSKEHFGKGMAFRAAIFLTNYMWDSIGEVVVAARAAMDWLQDVAKEMNWHEKPMYWTTYDGFPALTYSREIETVRIDTELGGSYNARVGIYTDRLAKHKQRNGIAPNMVHSQDATHLRLTVRNAVAAGIQDLALIHDDYGTHAANTGKLHRIIRESFVELYRNFDALWAFKEAQEKAGGTIKNPPPKGDLKLSEILKSMYFFA